MAKKQSATPSLRSYFLEVFTDNKEYLRGRSNAPVAERYMLDHNGQEMGKREKDAMANVKSELRKKWGIRPRRRRRKGWADKAAPNAAPRPRLSLSALERLEIAIDNCLSAARNLDPEGLEGAIKALRAARNAVVYKQGE